MENYNYKVVIKIKDTKKTFIVDADSCTEDGSIRIREMREAPNDLASEYPTIELDLDEVIREQVGLNVKDKIAERLIKKAAQKNPDGYELFFAYDDKISANMHEEAFEAYCEAVRTAKAEKRDPDYYDFEQYLYDTLFEKWIPYEQQDFAVETEVRGNVGYTDWPKIEEYLERNALSISEAIDEQGGNAGVFFDIKDVLDDSKVNIMFATDQEQNRDMCSIQNMLQNYTSDEAKYDNALSFVVCQQGHKIEELMNAVDADTHTENKFIDSVKAEAFNNTLYSMTEVTALVTLSGKNALDVLDMIAKGEGTLRFSTDTMLGLFNEWQGACSLLEIKLEKPLAIPSAMVRNLQFEGAFREHSLHGYTVDDVYGLIGSCWKGSVCRCDDKETVSREDFEKELKGFKK